MSNSIDFNSLLELSRFLETTHEKSGSEGFCFFGKFPKGFNATVRGKEILVVNADLPKYYLGSKKAGFEILGD